MVQPLWKIVWRFRKKKSETQSYRTTQQLHSWAEGKQMSTEKRARERSQQRDPK